MTGGSGINWKIFTLYNYYVDEDAGRIVIRLQFELVQWVSFPRYQALKTLRNLQGVSLCSAGHSGWDSSYRSHWVLADTRDSQISTLYNYPPCEVVMVVIVLIGLLQAPYTIPLFASRASQDDQDHQTTSIIGSAGKGALYGHLALRLALTHTLLNSIIRQQHLFYHLRHFSYHLLLTVAILMLRQLYKVDY